MEKNPLASGLKKRKGFLWSPEGDFWGLRLHITIGASLKLNFTIFIARDEGISSWIDIHIKRKNVW